MAGQNQADLFDTYFRRADLDHDGRISGAEAVAFFQGSNLSKPVLAQIWNHADQNRTGFLGRAEFYNALKLVTVAQSKRELTQDIVKAALFGPAAAKIPAPQINLQAIPGPGAAAPSPHMGVAAPTGPQNLGFRGPQAPPNAGMAQQYLPPQGNQFMRPPQMPAGAGLVPPQGVPGQGFPRGSTVGGGSTMGVGSTMGPRPPTSNVSTDWLGARPAGAPVGTTSQAPSRGVTPSTPLDTFGQFGLTSSLQPRSLATSAVAPSVALKSQDQPQLSFQPAAKDSKSLVVAGNGFASDSVFGGDVFSATSSQTKSLSAPTYSASSLPASSAIVPVTSGPQTSVKQSPLDSLQSTFTMQPGGGQLQRTQSLVKQNQQTPTPSTSGFVSSGMPSGAANPASSQSQLSWPRMTQSDVQKYTKVFVEVDTDRDGKITGEQARNLFLHWKLPREVLKHVWDLSDQDNDSMLSLREFCTALYLMERYREGRPLPPVLPNNIMFDETLMTTGGQQTAAYGNAAWRPSSGMQPQHGLPGAQPITPRGGGRPQMQVPYHPQADGVQPDQKKSKVPVLEKHLVNQLSTEEQNSLNSKFKEASDADKKVEELEKEILDSREKIEYYRTKMQELVLYKSRCDNRLNEIMERAIADKKEVESLSKKYEEKYKQVGDVASKLTIEEATFREIHERKMELYNAIVKIEQGGSADGILQVRADRIQSDLEELVKALNERCKKYGLKVKPTALVELPFGWQSGIQEGAADWDEDWDKFEDEGFSFVKELTVDVQNVIAPPKEKSKPVRKEKPSIDEGSAVSSPNANGKTEVPSGTSEHAHEGGSTYAHSEDESARSLPGSPVGRNSLESPSREFRDNHFEKNSEADSPFHSKENHSDHGGAESSFSGDKGFDEPSWGTFDTNDDTDSVWGNPINTREMDHERHGENSFFGSGSDFGLNRIRTDSPQGDSFFGRNTFADSVPGTPLFNSGLSPPRFSEASEDHSFDVLNFGSRYDSFSMSRNDSRRENLARFDSIRSTNDSEYGRGGVFASFDESDPFGSSGPFRPSETPKTPKKASDSWSAF